MKTMMIDKAVDTGVGFVHYLQAETDTSHAWGKIDVVLNTDVAQWVLKALQ